MWRNWQTRQLQVLVRAISCGFKSRHPHQNKIRSVTLSADFCILRKVVTPFMIDYTRLFKHDVKKNSNMTCLAIILYTLACYAVVILSQIVSLIFISITFPANEQDMRINEYAEKTSNSAWSTMAGILVGLVIIYLFSRRENVKSLIFSRKRKMTPQVFFMLLLVFMMPQIPSSYLSTFIESGFNMFGLTTQSDLEWATGQSTSFSMFIYASFFAPVCEEIVYRGYVMRNMQRYGKSFAIIFSSALFGIMHGNIHQILFAFVIGLVLGYTAMEYSIKWSIALHMINNFVFGDLLDGILNLILPEQAANVISWLILVALMFGGIVVLIVKRKEIKQYFSTLNFKNKRMYGWAFTTPAFIIFFIFSMYQMISSISRL